MSASRLFGASVLAGGGMYLFQHVMQDAQEQQNVREMTSHLLSIKTAYAETVAAMARAAHRQEQRLAHMSLRLESQSADSVRRPYTPTDTAVLSNQ